MVDYTDFKAGLENANAYLDARHHLTNTTALGNDALRVVTSAQYSFTLRELLCGMLSGNGIKLPNIQICLHANIQALLGIPNLQAELRDALLQLDGAFQEFMDHTKLDSILGRLNGILAEAQNVANMINFCSAPVDPIAIPNMLERAFGSFLGAGMDLINQIGSIAPENVCACIGTNGFNTNVFNGGILGNISNNFNAINAGTLSSSVIDSIRNDIEGVSSGLRNLINFENGIRGAYDLGGSQFATPDPGCNSNIGVLHNPANGSIASNARLTSSLKALYDNLAGYPVVAQDGTEYANIFHLLLEPEFLELLDRQDDPNPTVSTQTPVYDYCGNIVGYTQNITQQDTQESAGSTPTAPNSPGYLAGGLVTDVGNTATNSDTVQTTSVEYTVNQGGSTVYIVSSEQAQLALQTNTHDIVVRSDILTTFVRKSTVTDNTGTMSDYQQASVTFTAFGQNVNELQGDGFVIKDGTGAVTRLFIGTPNQIEILNADGRGGDPVFKISDNVILPGTESATIPKGTTLQRPAVPQTGMIRFNSETDHIEAYFDAGNQWQRLATQQDLSAQAFDIINVGNGAEIHKQLNASNEHELRTLRTGGSLTITQNDNNIEIGENLTASNLGSGAGLFAQRSNENFQFKSITVSGNLTLTESNDSVDISSDPRLQYASLTTTTDASTTVQFSDTALQPDVGKTWMFTVHVLAGDTATTRRGWKLEGIVQNTGTPSLVGTVVRTDYQRTTSDSNAAEWATLTAYNPGDIVEYDLVLYRALNVIPSSNYTPPPNPDWIVDYAGWNAAARIVNNNFVIQVRGDSNTVNWSVKFEYIEI